MLILDSLLNYAITSQEIKGREQGRGNIKLNGFIAIILTLGTENLHKDDGREPQGTDEVSYLYVYPYTWLVYSE